MMNRSSLDSKLSRMVHSLREDLEADEARDPCIGPEILGVVTC